MGTRRRARESALQILFGLDWVDVDREAAMHEYWTRFAGERPTSFEEVHRHCAELVDGVVQHRALLDQRLQAASHHWKLDRMSAVDRNILRLGALELLVLGDRVPRKVAINEAVEIAKKFGNEDSSAFVNGILDRLANALGSERPPRAEKDPAAERGRGEKAAARREEKRKVAAAGLAPRATSAPAAIAAAGAAIAAAGTATAAAGAATAAAGAAAGDDGAVP